LNKVTKNNSYYEINNKKRENIIRKQSGQAMVTGYEFRVSGFEFSIINNQLKGRVLYWFDEGILWGS